MSHQRHFILYAIFPDDVFHELQFIRGIGIPRDYEFYAGLEYFIPSIARNWRFPLVIRLG